MQLKEIKTNQERIKHAMQSSKERDVLLFVIADLEKRIEALEKPVATTTVFTAFAPKKKEGK